MSTHSLILAMKSEEMSCLIFIYFDVHILYIFKLNSITSHKGNTVYVSHRFRNESDKAQGIQGRKNPTASILNINLNHVTYIV